MLKFYHVPPSSNGRRVWMSLLEKQLKFEDIRMQLNGDQMQPNFLAMNPFHHIPVLADDDFTVIESLAILDYLDAQYPDPCFTPTDAKSLATMRMIQMVSVNELQPNLFPLIRHRVGSPEDPATPLKAAQEKVTTVLDFYQKYLGDKPYLVGEQMTLADIVVISLFLDIKAFRFPVEDYPKLMAWSERLMERESVQKTTPTSEDMEGIYAFIKNMIEGE
ncbi:MAG: glutathione S-transferase family protein [Microcoleaceae cyanobacterium]